MKKGLLYGIVFLILIASALADIQFQETFESAGWAINWTSTSSSVSRNSTVFVDGAYSGQQDDTGGGGCGAMDNCIQKTGLYLENNTVFFSFYFRNSIGDHQLIIQTRAGITDGHRFIYETGDHINYYDGGYFGLTEIQEGWNYWAIEVNSGGMNWCDNSTGAWNCSQFFGSATYIDRLEIGINNVEEPIPQYDHIYIGNGTLTELLAEIGGGTPPPPPPVNSSMNVTLQWPKDDWRQINYSSETEYIFMVNSNQDIDNCSIYTDEGSSFEPHHTLHNNVTGLVSYYSFDNRDVEDNWGNESGRNQGAEYVDGYLNGGLKINRTNDDYVELTNNVYDGENITVAFWMYPYDVSEEAYYIFGHNTTGTDEKFWIEIRNQMMRVVSNNGTSELSDYSLGVSSGAWQFVAITRNGSSGTVYVDGSKDGVTYREGSIYDGTNPYWISSPYTYNEIDGIMDEFMIFNRSLTDSEISEIYTDTRHYTPILKNVNISITPTTNTNDTEKDILWNVFCESLNASAFAAANFTLQVDQTPPFFYIYDPLTPLRSANSTGFELSFTINDTQADLYRVNISLFYASNDSLIKNVAYWDDLNATSLTDTVTVNWSDLGAGVYYVEINASDEIAQSPVMKDYKAKTGSSKEVLLFQDESINLDIKSTLEVITKHDNKKWSLDQDSLDVIIEKTTDDKHIHYGGFYDKDELPNDARFRYVYESMNSDKLILINPETGHFIVDKGIQNIYYDHTDLIEEGFYIDTYTEGEKIVVEFWKNNYKDRIKFDPLTGGTNFGGIKSVNVTKAYSLNISAIDGYTNASISNFTVSISGPYTDQESTTNESVEYVLLPGNYTLQMNATGYNYQSQTIELNGTSNLTFTLYANNSLIIYIRDSDTSLPITENVTVLVASIYNEYTYYTNTSQLIIQDLTPTDYVLKFSSLSYNLRTYGVTVTDNNHTILYIYLNSNTNQVIFTAMNRDTSTTIEGISTIMSRIINGSWVTIESKNTDLTGRASFQYVNDVRYRFSFTGTGYEDKIFYLDPILYDAYDVLLTPTGVINTSMDYSQVYINYEPKYYPRNHTINFNMTFSSPGYLIGYGYNISYPSVTYQGTGSTATGETFNLNFYINETTSDILTLEYYYTTGLAGTRYFKETYHIDDYYNWTAMSNKGNTFGLGILERVLVAILIIIFFVGITSFLGFPIGGLAIGLFLLGYLSYIGFVPLWATLPSFFVGVIILIKRSD